LSAPAGARLAGGQDPDRPGTVQAQLIDQLAAWPWWAIFIVLAGLGLAWLGANDATYRELVGVLAAGLLVTLRITAVAYVLAILLGLVAGLGRLSRRPLIYNLATLYVQLIRGVPILVQIIYFAFVLTPLLVGAANWLGDQLAGLLGPDNALAALSVRDLSFEARVTLALGIAYGAFEAETFRAGIESLGRGQAEAARSLGMSQVQTMRHVVLPQAIRRVLPTLGNDLISMLKDSSLASVLGVLDVTRLGQRYASVTFRAAATYNTVAFFYLTMTLTLSLLVRWLERRFRQAGHGG
jgi:polar amino acid transport system permease protein